MKINVFGYEVIFRHRRTVKIDNVAASVRGQFPKVVTPLDLQRWLDKVQEGEPLTPRTVNALKRAHTRDPLLDFNATIAGKRLVRHIGPSARAELQAAIKEVDCEGLSFREADDPKPPPGYNPGSVIREGVG